MHRNAKLAFILGENERIQRLLNNFNLRPLGGVFKLGCARLADSHGAWSTDLRERHFFRQELWEDRDGM